MTNPALPPELTERLARRLTSDLKPVAPIVSPRVLSIRLAVAFLLLAAAGGYGLGPRAIEAMSPTRLVPMLASLTAGAVLASLSLAAQTIPGSRERTPRALAVLVPVWFLTAYPVLFRVEAEAAFWKAGLICLALGAGFAVVAAVVSFRLLRRGAFLWPRRAGATAGLLAGLAGLGVLTVHCPVFDLRHLLAWHLGAVLLSILAGCGAGYTVERARITSDRSS